MSIIERKHKELITDKLLREILEKVTELMKDEIKSHRQREEILKEQTELLKNIEKMLKKHFEYEETDNSLSV